MEEWLIGINRDSSAVSEAFLGRQEVSRSLACLVCVIQISALGPLTSLYNQMPSGFFFKHDMKVLVPSTLPDQSYDILSAH